MREIVTIYVELLLSLLDILCLGDESENDIVVELMRVLHFYLYSGKFFLLFFRFLSCCTRVFFDAHLVRLIH